MARLIAKKAGKFLPSGWWTPTLYGSLAVGYASYYWSLHAYGLEPRPYWQNGTKWPWWYEQLSKKKAGLLDENEDE
eukprot:GDKH01001964.1.p4 GENE.GDKH01001964.1~~GDKH01001964.1.p4  ORF type:complete len:76 (-),score=8.54 GDKH01001964.1:205-432(-)